MFWTALFSRRKVKAGLPSESQEDLNIIKGMVEEGTFKAVIDRTYPLEATAEAHRYVDAGHKEGNVVITVT